MQFNLLHFMWVTYSFVITCMGINILFLEQKLPFCVTRMFKFGKTGKSHSRRKSFVQYFEVPKRWFSHFYVFASIYLLILTLEVCRRYFIGSSTSAIDMLLDIFTINDRKSSISAESAIVMSVLLLLQVCRRCYECFFVSVYSDGKMNILHYVVGLTFYFGVGLSVLSEAPGFEHKSSGFNRAIFFLNWFSWDHLMGISVFLLGFLMQYQATVALASLRKDNEGKKVVTMKHVMPVGGLFDYVSCPHYFAEIVMYLSGNVIMDGQNWTWWLLCLWIVSNQTITGLMSHQWYQRNFKNYPPSRKAVIPWLL